MSCGVVVQYLVRSINLHPLGHIIQKHNVTFHCFVNDTQIYVPLELNN